MNKNKSKKSKKLKKSEDQTYCQFAEMGKREPNDEGTGRFLLEEGRKIIGIMNLSNQKKSKMIGEWIQAYCQLETRILSTQFKIQLRKKQYRLINLHDQSYYIINQNQNRLNVFEIMDVLIDFIPQDIYAMVVIIDQEIFDPEDINTQIAGRAINQRINVIGQEQNQELLFGTILHELMHNFGIDHCRKQCLMNAIMNEQLMLCENDYRKLKLAVGFRDKQRQDDLMEIFEKYKLNGGKRRI